MTALPEYQRLESPALWREAPEAKRREVQLSLGKATLIISDERSGLVLTHWSLPAVVRLNAGQEPALFAPSSEAQGEELEIADKTMAAALEKVQAQIEARRPHPGRLRGRLTGGLVLAALLGFGTWLPAALIGHVAEVAPLSKQVEIGQMALGALTRLTGQPCHSPEGDVALARLASRLKGPREIVVLPEALMGARRLPGGIVALGQPLLASQDTPEVAAGHIITAELAAQKADPLDAALSHAGFRAAFTLLTTGKLPPEAFEGYGAVLLAASNGAEALLDPAEGSLDGSDPALAEAILAEFARTGVSATPYAYSLDPSGERVLGLIEADPFRGNPAPEPVMQDADWLALQTICEG